MSGLAGCISLDGAPVDPEVARRLAESTPYLGPDGADVWCDGAAALVRFRHATTPQAVGERQPIVDERAGLVVCLDGRFDNRSDLLDALRDDALDSSAGDAALLLALYARYAERCVDHLVGDYAFAVWQPRARRLFCARSPVGWRPLCWWSGRGRLGFATEPKALVEALAIDRRLNEGAIAEYLSLRFTTQTDTFWQDVHRLAPGSALSAEDGRVRVWHWHTGPFSETSHLDEAAHCATFRRLFDQAIVATLRSSTAVAAHLSGGLDSSSIVCRATGLHRAGLVDRPVRPVSARFPGELQDETDWSLAVEAHAGVEASVVTAGPYDWDRAADWSARTWQLPLRPNVLGTYVATCKRLRADGIRVLLTGEGGDDWLRGSHAHWPDLVRRGDLRQLLREGVAAYAGRSSVWRLRSVLSESVGPLVSRPRRDRVIRPHLDFSHAAPEWVSAEWAGRVGLQDRWRLDRLPVNLGSTWQEQRYGIYTLARRHINVDNVLSFAAAQGVELRHPFHDRRLTEYLMAAPGDLFLRGSGRKHLLREAMRGVLPETVRTRSTKADFSTPFIDALDRKSDEDLGTLQVVRRGWVDGRRLIEYRSAYRRWTERGRPLAEWPNEPIAPVWAAAALDLWLTRAFGT